VENLSGGGADANPRENFKENWRFVARRWKAVAGRKSTWTTGHSEEGISYSGGNVVRCRPDTGVGRGQEVKIFHTIGKWIRSCIFLLAKVDWRKEMGGGSSTNLQEYRGTPEHK